MRESRRAEKTQFGTSGNETLTRQQQQNLKLSQNWALEAAKGYMMLVNTLLTTMGTKETDEQHMRELLNDAVDLVAENGDDGGDKVAMMHWSKNEDRRGKMDVTSGTSKLSLVDQGTDPRMFPVLDDGCYATVRTTEWSQQGRMLGPVQGKPRQHTCLGGATTSGHRVVPRAIRVSRDQHLFQRIRRRLSIACGARIKFASHLHQRLVRRNATDLRGRCTDDSSRAPETWRDGA